MILSDVEIREYVRRGELGIDPFVSKNVQPASIDFTLGSSFSLLENSPRTIIHPDDDLTAMYRTVYASRFIILPHQFVLATTQEYIKLPNNLSAFVEGRSSWGRLGLFIQNAGWIDPGFEGEITLELYNANSRAIELCEGMRIGQFVFAKMETDAIMPYRGKYQKQRQATGSKLNKDFYKGGAVIK